MKKTLTPDGRTVFYAGDNSVAIVSLP
jgi:hypothetical protein